MIEQIKNKYNVTEISENFEKVLNNRKTFKNAIMLSDEKILNADKDFQVDFKRYGLIPVCDIFDNDFICYQIANGKWCIFNIVEEISFKKDSSFEDLVKFK